MLLSITASTMLLPTLDALPAELDRLVAAAVQPSTAAIWADIRAAGQRKLVKREWVEENGKKFEKLHLAAECVFSRAARPTPEAALLSAHAKTPPCFTRVRARLRSRRCRFRRAGTTGSRTPSSDEEGRVRSPKMFRSTPSTCTYERGGSKGPDVTGSINNFKTFVNLS